MPQDPRFATYNQPKERITPAPRSPLDWLTSSLVPDEMVEGAQDFIDSPSLNRPKWQAQLEGFGAGALGGLADMASPLGMGMATLGGVAPGAFGGASGASRMLGRAGRGPNPMRGQNSSSQSFQALKQATPEAPPMSQSAGMRDPSFTAVGDEAVYNMHQPSSTQTISDLYDVMAKKLGMARPSQ